MVGEGEHDARSADGYSRSLKNGDTPTVDVLKWKYCHSFLLSVLTPEPSVSKSETIPETILCSDASGYADNGRIGYSGRLGQLALDAVHVVLQSDDSSTYGSDGLTYYTSYICVLMLEVELRGERAVLLAQGVDFVLQSRGLQLVELGNNCRSPALRSLANRALERVGLLAVGQTGFVALALDGGADVAAARCHLREHLRIARLNGVDNLLCREPRLRLNVAECRLNLLYRTVERRGELVDRRTIALDGVHQKLTSCVTIQLGGKILKASATTETAPAVTTPDGPKQNHPHPLPAIAVPITITVVTVHQGSYEVAIHRATVVEH
uniref:Uncharacterized protein n=1 Tax=Siphoviridae sp. ctxdc10 TaxID=2825740 RepID=A0A8S5TSG2_9CAUD|nr:MAG TPA: hypothetical protein [Siphoviridae sp. ctxdc10]